MPERPKRRKNNKNKRKNNRGNRSEVADNSSSPSASENVSLSVDASSENLVSLEEEKQNSDNLENVANDIPIDEICSKVGNDAPSEDVSEDIVVKNETDLILGNKDSHEEPLEKYVVETPDQTKKNIPKLSNSSKSKSVDNDDSPTIVEITDEDNSQISNSALPLIDSNNIVVSDIECDILWQKVDDLVNFSIDPDENHLMGALSITTLPLNIAQCNQTKALSPEEELSLRSYLKTLNLSTNPESASASEIKSEIQQIINREVKYRLRKKGLAEDNFMLRVGPSRSLALDVIDEEGSSESSMTSRRQSSLIDKKSDNEELDDDVFDTKVIHISKNKVRNIDKKNFGSHIIPQECIRVDAKIKEPEITEARGSWTTKIVEKATGAELVYLTDSSSSTSSIYDVNEDNENSEDSDRSVRIITPTIEVTDTEKLLTDLSKRKTDANNSNENSDYFLIDKKDVKCNESNVEETNNEIIVESTENIKTDLIVKDIDQDIENSDEPINEIALQRSPKAVDKYDLEIKVLKCELNDAINNLIKEVNSDSESVKDCSNEHLSRQDSSSSVGSSQCTAKYNPTHSSLNDVSGIVHDSHEITSEPSSHVKDVLEHVPQFQTTDKTGHSIIQVPSLRDICLQKISLLPYGDKILEELAEVSSRLQHLSAFSFYPSSVSSTNRKTNENENHKSKILSLDKNVILSTSHNVYTPPPLLPRKSSLKKSQDDKRPKIPPKPDNIQKCLSPSQKMLMEKTNTSFTHESVKTMQNLLEKDHSNAKVDTTVSRSTKNSNEPFKSQTGSRLLSLICDSSINNTISSSLLKSFSNKHLDPVSKAGNTKTFSNYESKSEYFPKSLFSSSKPKTFSSSFYESDDSSDYTGNLYKNTRNERKYFHYSTGNLNSEIEDDISSIQNMHRYYTDIRNERTKEVRPRRPSLPKDLCDQQMEYIRQKEREVDAEIRRLEEKNLNPVYKTGPRAPMILENDDVVKENINFQTCKATNKSSKVQSLFSSSEEELLREKMYTEYVNQMAEREYRKEHKIIKITKPMSTTRNKTTSQSMPILDPLDSKVNNRIEREFITRARERWDKLGIKEYEAVDEKTNCDLYSEPKIVEHKIKVIDAGEEKDVNNLPNHIQDFVKFTATRKEKESEGMGECEPGNPPKHVVVLCAVIILMLTVGKYFLRLLRNT